MGQNFFSLIGRNRLAKQSELSQFAGEREPDSLLRSWRKPLQTTNRASGLTNILSSFDRRISRIRRASMQDEAFFPFRCYQAPSIDNLGNGYTFQVRGGLVGFRNRIYPSTVGGEGVSTPFIGYYEPVWGIFDGVDDPSNLIWDSPNIGIYNQPDLDSPAVRLDIPNTGDMLLTNGDPGFSFGGVQFSLDPTLDTNGYANGSVWIEVIDDVGSFTLTLNARMWTDVVADPTGRSTQAFPDASQYIIPVARLFSSNGQSDALVVYEVEQYLTSLLINRYLPGQMTTRGDWTGDSLSGQVFWPGDVVTYNNGVKTYTLLHGESIEVITDTNPLGYNFTSIAQF